jgi:hypothetical protein
VEKYCATTVLLYHYLRRNPEMRMVFSAENRTTNWKRAAQSFYTKVVVFYTKVVVFYTKVVVFYTKVVVFLLFHIICFRFLLLLVFFWFLWFFLYVFYCYCFCLFVSTRYILKGTTCPTCEV